MCAVSNVVAVAVVEIDFLHRLYFTVSMSISAPAHVFTVIVIITILDGAVSSIYIQTKCTSC